MAGILEIEDLSVIRAFKSSNLIIEFGHFLMEGHIVGKDFMVAYLTPMVLYCDATSASPRFEENYSREKTSQQQSRTSLFE